MSNSTITWVEHVLQSLQARFYVAITWLIDWFFIALWILKTLTLSLTCRPASHVWSHDDHLAQFSLYTVTLILASYTQIDIFELILPGSTILPRMRQLQSVCLTPLPVAESNQFNSRHLHAWPTWSASAPDVPVVLEASELPSWEHLVTSLASRSASDTKSVPLGQSSGEHGHKRRP